MIELKLNKRILLVEVPEDSNSFEIYDNNVVGGKCIMYFRGNPDYACNYTGNLPPGNWSEPIKCNEVSEETAKDLVSTGDFFPDYYQRYFHFDTALESFRSILTHHKLQPDKTILLIEKQESMNTIETDKIHPEAYCQMCGNSNPTWFCENDLFNKINGSPNGILCPSCFDKKAKQSGINIIFEVIQK